MGWIEKRNELKLDILDSLARSQRAMARMMESIADVTGASEETARAIHDNLKVITEYQRTLMVKMVDLAPGEIRSSGITPPWTNKKQKVSSGASKRPNSSPHGFSKKPSQP